MKCRNLIITLALTLAVHFYPVFTYGEEGSHDDAHNEEGHAHEKGHSEEKAHAEGEESHDHGHEEEEEEEKANVGPDKGIISFSEKTGFVLSPEAYKNFGIQTQKLEGSSPWTLPSSVLLLTGEEKNIYRSRERAFKRIDITIQKKTKENVTFTSKDLRAGDEAVIRGVGFLRVAEVDATSGESGHHH